MALGIPPLMSPVGVNSEIVTDGVDGYLPADEDAWVERISTLIEDAALRREMGKRARDTVVERYSVRAWRDRYLDLFRSVAT